MDRPGGRLQSGRRAFSEQEDMAENSDSRVDPSGNADWMFLALTPLLIAAAMLATAAAFAGNGTEAPAATAIDAQAIVVSQN